MTENPLLHESTLPYQLPPFGKIKDEHYLPALEQGIAEHAAEVASIAANPGPPTFDNTIVALERSGQLLRRAYNVFSNQAGSATNLTIRDIESDITPKLAAHQDAVHLNSQLFARIQHVFDGRDSLTDPEQRRLLERYHTDFVRAGAGLDPAGQERLRELNSQLATLCLTFQQNLLDDTNAALVVVDSREELAGLADDAIAAAAQTARERGYDGKYAFSLTLFSVHPALSSLRNRALRQRLYEASITRGVNSNADIVPQLATLRAERARLLGYATHADYVIADQTARQTGRVVETLREVTPAAVANAAREAELLQQSAGDEPLAAWDWAYHANQVRKERYDIDTAALRPYCELERVLHDGVFFAAGKLYGLSFAERPDLTGYLPEVRVFEVFDADGSPLGLYLADLYARASKRGGAWMNSLVDQSKLFGTKPVVVNNLNIPRPPDGQPTLLTMDEVRTLFHEFGHALHGLFSAVTYPRFAGTSVPRDFVEYPSQVNEMWLAWPEVLANYARHYQTGEPMPAGLITRMQQARQFNEGFRTVEYLAATLLDLAWHQLGEEDDPGITAEFEATALRDAGLQLPTIAPRYRSTYFAHIFSGGAGGYSAGYYSYLWSEILDADTVDWFRENGGLRRENGDRFRSQLLSRGGSVDPLDAFESVRGRAPKIEPLLIRRGLSR